MTARLTAIAAAAMLALLLPAAALAASGYATGSVNLRSGPGTDYRVITTIPAGASVEVYGCDGWCRVDYRGYRGWASARYISSAPPRYRPPVIERPYRPYRPPYDPFRPYPRRDPYCGPGALYGGVYCESQPN